MAPKTRASTRADKAVRDPSPPPSSSSSAAADSLDLPSAPAPGSTRRILQCVLIPAKTSAAIHADRAQKLRVTEQEYKDVVKTQQEDYESDIGADSDNDVDEFRTLFDADTQKLTTTPPLAPAPVPTAFSRDNLHLVKQQWTKVYNDHGLKALATALVKEEIDARLSEKNALISDDVSWASQAMYDILLTMDADLIKSIMNGNISFDKRQNPRLRAELAKIREQSKHQPSIYHQSLVDEDGLSPTPNKLREMLGYMENYMKACLRDDKLPETKDIKASPMARKSMCEVDSLKNFVRKKFDKDKFDKMHFAKYMWHVVYVPASASTATSASTFTSTSKGKGKSKASMPLSSPVGSDYNSDDSSFAKTKQKKKQQIGLKVPEWRYCKAHVIQTKAFVRALRERLDSIDPADQDKPLQFPLVEVGYAKESIKRLSTHKSHCNSNYIMNLMDALFTLWGPTIGTGKNERPKYRIEQEVIALIWKVDQAEVSEIGLTKLAEGYIHNAGGFSHFPAGLSNDSAHRLRPKVWSAAQEWVLRHTCYRSNLQHIVDKLTAQVTAVKVNNEELRKKIRISEQGLIENEAKDTAAVQDTIRQLRKDGEELPEEKEIQDLKAKIDENALRLRLDYSDLKKRIQFANEQLGLLKLYDLLGKELRSLAIIADAANPNPMYDSEEDMDEEELDNAIAELTAEVDDGEAGQRSWKEVAAGGEF